MSLKTLFPSGDAEYFDKSKFDGSKNLSFVFGLDEVGVGCLAGPVVASCFAYPCDFSFHNIVPPVVIADSKKLDENRRARAELWLCTLAEAHHAVAEASVQEIDEINILNASGLAMFRAFEKVKGSIEIRFGKNIQAAVLIDGNRVPKNFQSLPQNFSVFPIVKGDTKVFAIAAASIMAKNSRDLFMSKLAEEYTDYGWQTNVGYPTPAHKNAVRQMGPTPWHRRSFNLDF